MPKEIQRLSRFTPPLSAYDQRLFGSYPVIFLNFILIIKKSFHGRKTKNQGFGSR